MIFRSDQDCLHTSLQYSIKNACVVPNPAEATNLTKNGTGMPCRASNLNGMKLWGLLFIAL